MTNLHLITERGRITRRGQELEITPELESKYFNQS